MTSLLYHCLKVFCFLHANFSFSLINSIKQVGTELKGLMDMNPFSYLKNCIRVLPQASRIPGAFLYITVVSVAFMYSVYCAQL